MADPAGPPPPGAEGAPDGPESLTARLAAESVTAAAAQRRRKRRIRLAVWVLVLAAVALLLPRYALQVALVDSYSMIPSLEEGDRVFIEKVSARFGLVSRGTVVVVADPDRSRRNGAVSNGAQLPPGRVLAADDGGELVLKRIVAVGGDTIEARDGKVHVNGEAIEEPYLAPDVLTQDFGPVTVPDDHVFVIGDNRNASWDSRAYGSVPGDDVVGRVLFRLWPISRWGAV